MEPFTSLPLIPTTVVGSFPVVRGSGIGGLLDPLKYAVKVAVDAQVTAGIDIISDGQVRGDMIQAFTRHLPGIRGQDVVGKVLPASGPITVPDTRYACSRHSFVKGILTGPTTLSHGLHISTPLYRDRSECAQDLAAALSMEARSLERAGVCMIQVDEPILSTGAAHIDEAREAFSRVISGLKVPICLHVCGDLSSIVDQVLKFPIAVLDIECARSPGNLDLLNSTPFQGMKAGIGCIDSSSTAVESVPEIRQRILHAVEMLGPENVLIDPDCGLRMLPLDAAVGKLTHMVTAVKEVRKELA